MCLLTQCHLCTRFGDVIHNTITPLKPPSSLIEVYVCITSQQHPRLKLGTSTLGVSRATIAPELLMTAVPTLNT